MTYFNSVCRSRAGNALVTRSNASSYKFYSRRRYPLNFAVAFGRSNAWWGAPNVGESAYASGMALRDPYGHDWHFDSGQALLGAAVDSQGNVFFSGYGTTNWVGGNGSTVANLWKFNASGVLQWAKNIASLAVNYPIHLRGVDGNDDLYLQSNNRIYKVDGASGSEYWMHEVVYPTLIQGVAVSGTGVGLALGSSTSYGYPYPEYGVIKLSTGGSVSWQTQLGVVVDDEGNPVENGAGNFMSYDGIRISADRDDNFVVFGDANSEWGGPNANLWRLSGSGGSILWGRLASLPVRQAASGDLFWIGGYDSATATVLVEKINLGSGSLVDTVTVMNNYPTVFCGDGDGGLVLGGQGLGTGGHDRNVIAIRPDGQEYSEWRTVGYVNAMAMRPVP
jgi:hypothetical protein